uniref:Uncharacterized protein n=1 Tax=Lolium perenne TaxID=4522 RepID=B2RGD8_LOLPR|nr:hypothetical protein [Lolium perenne]
MLEGAKLDPKPTTKKIFPGLSGLFGSLGIITFAGTTAGIKYFFGLSSVEMALLVVISTFFSVVFLYLTTMLYKYSRLIELLISKNMEQGEKQTIFHELEFSLYRGVKLTVKGRDQLKGETTHE